jgi:transglutaminase-like putative cysteine protease
MSLSKIAGCIFALAVSLNFPELHAQKTPMYAFSDIPAELLKNSNAVVRNDITKYQIINQGKGKKYSLVAVTILNKKGDHFAEVRLGYDKLSKITSIKGRCFDKFGKVVEVLKNKDIEDYSAYDGFSIYSDNRVKYFDLRYPDYPYTIEYEVEEEDDGLFFTPGWMPYPAYNVSSQKSSLEIIAPNAYDIRYLELNMEPSAKKKNVNGSTSITWEFGNFAAIERESRMPSLKKIVPTILTGPSDFEMEGYAGTMTDWSGFGRWESMLNEGRDALPPEFTEKIRALVADVPGRSEKIKILYNYLQANTRYVSIQLGIGGWQTFPATDVVNNGYGDCKALSNFMMAMLKAVDIDSYYTLVRAGNNVSNIIKEFPSQQFNHVILCVPNYQDTVWLECTSQDNPFGYIGSFTGDRDVLVINENGGHIVHTRTYTKEENAQMQRTQAVLNQDGSAVIHLSVTSAGRQYERFSGLLDVGESEQKKWLYKNLDLPGFSLEDFSFDQKKQPLPELYTNINVTVGRFASVSGKRLFFQPNVFNKSGGVAIPQKERQYPFELDYPFVDSDTVEFVIPEGYHLEFLPEATKIESDFGNYEAKVLAQKNKVTYVRKRTMVKGTFPPKDYLKYVEFRNAIAEADKMKLVLVKAT